MEPQKLLLRLFVCLRLNACLIPSKNRKVMNFVTKLTFQIHDANIMTVAVGIGSNISSIKAIASSPIGEYSYFLAGYNDLTTWFADEMLRRVCSTPLPAIVSGTKFCLSSFGL